MSHRHRPATGIAGAVAAGVLGVLWVAFGVFVNPPTPPDSPAPAEYTREAFGDGWADLDGDGCDTRDEILERDFTDPVVDGCVVLAGQIDLPYAGRTVIVGPGDVSDIHIDHLVPLSYAWKYGANEWTLQRRVTFANDPINLLAVDGRLNMSKGDSGPSEWAPPAEAFRCDYAGMWNTVLSEYDLDIPGQDQTWIATACATGDSR